MPELELSERTSRGQRSTLKNIYGLVGEKGELEARPGKLPSWGLKKKRVREGDSEKERKESLRHAEFSFAGLERRGFP